MTRTEEVPEQLDLEDWARAEAETETQAPMTMEQMDDLIIQYRATRETYEQFKAQATEIYKQVSDLEAKVINAMKLARKSSYKVDGLGTAYISNKFVVRVPKDLQDKTKLFNYIRERHGPDVLMSMATINHQTLNSFFNAEAEKAATEKTEFALPGLEAPTHEESLGFRKK